MGTDRPDFTRLELQRTGRRGGCSCCSFTALGMLTIPLLLLALLVVAI